MQPSAGSRMVDSSLLVSHDNLDQGPKYLESLPAIDAISSQSKLSMDRPCIIVFLSDTFYKSGCIWLVNLGVSNIDLPLLP